MNKTSIIFAILLISLANVAAYQNSLDRTMFSAEEKAVAFDQIFDIKNKGIAKLQLDSGFPVEIGVSRPTPQDTDCSNYTPFTGTCAIVTFQILIPELLESGTSASFVLDQESGANTPYFDIILLDIKNNKKAKDVIYTLKIVEKNPSTVFVKRNEKFELMTNQIAKYGEFGIKNNGVGYNGEIYLDFMKGTTPYSPQSNVYKNKSYDTRRINNLGVFYEEEPLACLNEVVCVYYSGYATVTIEPKQDNYAPVTTTKIFLTISEKKEKTICISGDNFCPNNCTYRNDDECPRPDLPQIKPISEPKSNNTNIEPPSEINELTLFNHSNLSVAQVNSSLYNSTIEYINNEESKGLFNNIIKFFNGLLGKNK
ncbi:MAG: hypothetical protein ACP5N2_02555 [Candidatus Nanoarchaeia archaeon]